MFLGSELGRVGSELGGLGEEIWNIRCGDDFVLAEGVLTRARMRAPIQEFCFFAVTSVTVDGVEKTISP